MKSKEQVEGLLEGLKHDVEIVKENYRNGVINEEQQFAILRYKKAQIEILECVLK